MCLRRNLWSLWPRVPVPGGSGLRSLSCLAVLRPLVYGVPMVSDCKVFRDKKGHLLTSTSNIKGVAEGSLCVHMQLPG